MKRTQIYIDEETYRILKTESEVRKISVSELIRESLKNRVEGNSRKLMRGLDRAFGIWKNRKIDPEEYVRSMRANRQL